METKDAIDIVIELLKFEEGKKLAEQYGKENVYDFSLENPSVEPPKQIRFWFGKDERIYFFNCRATLILR